MASLLLKKISGFQTKNLEKFTWFKNVVAVVTISKVWSYCFCFVIGSSWKNAWSNKVRSHILYELRFNDILTSFVQFLWLALKIQIAWLLAKRSYEDHRSRKRVHFLNCISQEISTLFITESHLRAANTFVLHT